MRPWFSAAAAVGGGGAEGGSRIKYKIGTVRVIYNHKKSHIDFLKSYYLKTDFSNFGWRFFIVLVAISVIYIF